MKHIIAIFIATLTPHLFAQANTVMINPQVVQNATPLNNTTPSVSNTTPNEGSTPELTLTPENSIENTLNTSSPAFVSLVNNLGYNLKVYGSNFFSSKNGFGANDNSPVNPDYTISVGDEIIINISGSINTQHGVIVDRDSRIFIPQVGSVSVAGVKFRNLDSHLKVAISKMYRNFEVQTSLGKLKGLQVYITGNSIKPGLHTIASTGTLINLLIKSGGPNSQGSLRNIELRRGGQLVGKFDLYQLLLKGDKNADFSLMSGDVVYIPPVRYQVAIASGIQNPAIYEFKVGESLYELMQSVGSLNQSANTLSFRSERIIQDSGMTVSNVSFADSGKSYKLHEGEIISFGQTIPQFNNAVTLRGHVSAPGRIPFTAGMKITDIVSSSSQLITPDYFFNEQKVQNAGIGITSPSSINESSTESMVNWDYAVIERFNADSLNSQIIPFKLGKAILDKDPTENHTLQAGDIVTIFSNRDVKISVERKPIFVRLDGEVNHPGIYRMKFGETLQDLIKKAGGVTQQAYIFGSKFIRPSEAKSQKAQYSRILDEMQRQIEGAAAEAQSSAIGQESALMTQQQFKSQRAWLDQMRNYQPDGRIVLKLEQDSKVADIPNALVEDGDRLFIPNYPSTVGVYGEVAGQGAFLYEKGEDIGAYLEQSGGPNEFANESGIFVIRANGSVVSEKQYGFLFWQLPSMNSAPGDAIFVPKELRYNTFLPALKDWSQVLANIGLSAAAIVTLNNAVK